MRKYVVLRLCLALMFLVGLVPASPVSASTPPLVLAMYYAWFDGNSWDPGHLSDLPQQTYSSADRGTIERHVQQAKGAGIDAFELNWWGPGNPTDTNLQTLLSVAKAHDFKVTVDFDLNSPFINGTGDIINTLNYLKRYFGEQSWLHYEGKPVVVFYGIRKHSVATWASIRNQVDPGRQAVWIGEGDIFSYLDVFDGIHPYSIAWSRDPAAQLASYASRTRAYPGKIWMATVMPGYDDTRVGRSDGFAVNRQDGAYYSRVWQGAIATRPPIISITSFNEWPEGSQIEPGQRYGDLYLRLTRQWSDTYKSAAANQPTSQPIVNPTSNCAFYTQAGEGKGGYSVCNGQNVNMLGSFRALGDVAALGYPSSGRFEKDGFMHQAMQGAVLQWRPEFGRAVLANTFEWLTDAGKDDWLLEVKGIPRPIRDDGSAGNWEQAKRVRLSWLTNDAIRARYLAAGSLERAIELYGLPMSHPEKHGPFVTQRFQRIAFQLWVDSVPGMPSPGSVVRVLAGDTLKELGMIPTGAATPISAP
jgi:hypothetical protein